MKTNRLFSYVISMQCRMKVKTEKLLGMFLKDLQQRGLEIPCMFSVSSGHEKMLRRFEEYVKDLLSKKLKQN